VVRAPLDKRFLVYMLGRGVPPPNNNTLRWCTRQIKVDPMADAIEARIAEIERQRPDDHRRPPGRERGPRPAHRAESCSKDGGECGQGWYQQVLPNSKGVRGRIATLAPILHWRVCNVWDWLKSSRPGRVRRLADRDAGRRLRRRRGRGGQRPHRLHRLPAGQQGPGAGDIVRMPAWATWRRCAA
jgi:hypothetical protein